MTSMNDTRRARLRTWLRDEASRAWRLCAPERVFQALASNEISEWWLRPGVFDTREWTGD